MVSCLCNVLPESYFRLGNYLKKNRDRSSGMIFNEILIQFLSIIKKYESINKNVMDYEIMNYYQLNNITEYLYLLLT